MLNKIKKATEHDLYFIVDDGSGSSFKVAKSGLSDGMVDRIRRMYCGGAVKMADGGTVPDDEYGYSEEFVEFDKSPQSASVADDTEEQQEEDELDAEGLLPDQNRLASNQYAGAVSVEDNARDQDGLVGVSTENPSAPMPSDTTVSGAAVAPANAVEAAAIPPGPKGTAPKLPDDASLAQQLDPLGQAAARQAAMPPPPGGVGEGLGPLRRMFEAFDRETSKQQPAAGSPAAPAPAAPAPAVETKAEAQPAAPGVQAPPAPTEPQAEPELDEKKKRTLDFYVVPKYAPKTVKFLKPYYNLYNEFSDNDEFRAKVRAGFAEAYDLIEAGHPDPLAAIEKKYGIPADWIIWGHSPKGTYTGNSNASFVQSLTALVGHDKAASVYHSDSKKLKNKKYKTNRDVFEVLGQDPSYYEDGRFDSSENGPMKGSELWNLDESTVKEIQKSLNKKLKEMKLPSIGVDGKMGGATLKALSETRSFVTKAKKLYTLTPQEDQASADASNSAYADAFPEAKLESDRLDLETAKEIPLPKRQAIQREVIARAKAANFDPGFSSPDRNGSIDGPLTQAAIRRLGLYISVNGELKPIAEDRKQDLDAQDKIIERINKGPIDQPGGEDAAAPAAAATAEPTAQAAAAAPGAVAGAAPATVPGPAAGPAATTAAPQTAASVAPAPAVSQAPVAAGSAVAAPVPTVPPAPAAPKAITLEEASKLDEKVANNIQSDLIRYAQSVGATPWIVAPTGRVDASTIDFAGKAGFTITKEGNLVRTPMVDTAETQLYRQRETDATGRIAELEGLIAENREEAPLPAWLQDSAAAALVRQIPKLPNEPEQAYKDRINAVLEQSRDAYRARRRVFLDSLQTELDAQRAAQLSARVVLDAEAKLDDIRKRQSFIVSSWSNQPTGTQQSINAFGDNFWSKLLSGLVLGIASAGAAAGGHDPGMFIRPLIDNYNKRIDMMKDDIASQRTLRYNQLKDAGLTEQQIADTLKGDLRMLSASVTAAAKSRTKSREQLVALDKLQSEFQQDALSFYGKAIKAVRDDELSSNMAAFRYDALAARLAAGEQDAFQDAVNAIARFRSHNASQARKGLPQVTLDQYYGTETAAKLRQAMAFGTELGDLQTQAETMADQMRGEQPVAAAGAAPAVAQAGAAAAAPAATERAPAKSAPAALPAVGAAQGRGQGKAAAKAGKGKEGKAKAGQATAAASPVSRPVGQAEQTKAAAAAAPTDTKTAAAAGAGQAAKPQAEPKADAKDSKTPKSKLDGAKDYTTDKFGFVYADVDPKLVRNVPNWMVRPTRLKATDKAKLLRMGYRITPDELATINFGRNSGNADLRPKIQSLSAKDPATGRIFAWRKLTQFDAASKVIDSYDAASRSFLEAISELGDYFHRIGKNGQLIKPKKERAQFLEFIGAPTEGQSLTMMVKFAKSKATGLGAWDAGLERAMARLIPQYQSWQQYAAGKFNKEQYEQAARQEALAYRQLVRDAKRYRSAKLKTLFVTSENPYQ